MVMNQNAAIIDRMSEDLKESNVAALPKNIQTNIQPVLIVNPKKNTFAKYISQRSVTGVSTISTTSSDKDTYLTSINLSNQSDATADNVRIYVSVTLEDGSVAYILELSKITLTAFTGNMTKNINPPLKLKRGSSISLANVFTAGASVSSAGVTGYEVDTLNK